MPRNDKSVTFYTPAEIRYEFGFPNDYVNCFNCPFCYNDSVGRDRCSITAEILPFAHTERGTKCPAVIK